MSQRLFKTKRHNAGGHFTRRGADRLSREQLIFRASFLPAGERSLFLARVDRGMRLKEIAALQKATVYRVRRQLMRLHAMLTDPAFLLAARFAARLPEELRTAAEERWLAGMPLRDLASAHGETIHAVRRRLATARAMLLLEAKNDTDVGMDAALRLLEGRRAGVAA